MQQALETLLSGGTLSEDATRAVFDRMLEGEEEPARIAALLTLMQARGVSEDMLVGAARAMRERVARVPYTPRAGETVIDTCGTGGAAKTFNISTASAFVTASASALPGSGQRIRVAKHGNRSRTGRGSAEALAMLGVNVDASPETQARCLRDVGVCFCFAIHHHPATKHVAPVRKALAFPTIFNLLGPLTNPALAPRQLLGVFAPEFVEPMARALSRLGSERAAVVHGAGRMDEISTSGPTRIAHCEGSRVWVEEFDPAALGIARATTESLAASTLEEAADILRRVLEGERGPARDIVEVNSAMALWVGGAAPSPEAGLSLAREAIERGAALATLRGLVEASHRSADA
ncbi:MAG: anthranilate phosphoribosyltransferase [Phycisphaerales bacterium]